MKKITKSVSIPEITEALINIPQESTIFVDKAMAIAQRIVDALNEQRILQRDLADKMGKSEAEISKILSGTHNFTLRTIAKLEAALNIDIINISTSSGGIS